VADKMRAVPSSILRDSLRVDSCVAIVPSRGSVTVRPVHRMTPVQNRKESLLLPRRLNRGNPSFLPLRLPFDNKRSRFTEQGKPPSRPALGVGRGCGDSPREGFEEGHVPASTEPLAGWLIGQ
jgi:hypothetical protein